MSRPLRPPPPPPFTNWQDEVNRRDEVNRMSVDDDDEKTPQQDINRRDEVNRKRWDIMYYEVRHVLCNLWMKKILFASDSRLTDAREDHNFLAGLHLKAVNAMYLNSWEFPPFLDDTPPVFYNSTSNERLLNLLERIHRVVCSYPQEDRGLVETLLEDPNMPTEIAGVIAEFDANKIEWSAPPRQHGRSRCTCRLQHSNASNNDKKNRIDHIRRLVCNEWGEELDRILQIRPGQAGYLLGDGPFKQTKDDPDRDADDGESQWENRDTMGRLNEMLLILWRIICLPDAPVFYPPQPESTCPECAKIFKYWLARGGNSIAL